MPSFPIDFIYCSNFPASVELSNVFGYIRTSADLMGAFMWDFGQDPSVFQKLLGFLIVEVLLCFQGAIRYERA